MKFTINLSEFMNFLKENKSIDEFLRVKVIEFIKWLIEVTLEIQIEMLRDKHRTKGRRQRNGYYERSLLTRFGLIEKIRVPRLRGMSFYNLVFDKWQRRLESFDKMITMLFTQGESYRDIQRVVKEYFNEPFMSKSTISRITNKVFERVKEFHKRQIVNIYSIIWIDAVYFSIKDKSGQIEIHNKKRKKRKNFCVLMALGLNKQTQQKEIIDFMLAGKETAKNYKKFIQLLLDRGLNLNELELFVHDGDFAIRSAIKDIFGDIIKQQNCIFHKLQNINIAIENKNMRKKILNDASLVYKSSTYNEYIKRKKEFIEKYYLIEPLAVEIFKRDELIKTKFSFDLHLHHYINTTMPIDRTFREVRRRTNAIGCFESIKSADKILALIVEHINVELFGNASFIKI